MITLASTTLPPGIDEQVNGRFDAFAFGEDNGNLADPIPEPGRKACGFDIQKSETCVGKIKHEWGTAFLMWAYLTAFFYLRTS